MPIYAECGGFMYLCRRLVTSKERSHAMAGIFPFETRMQERLSALGCREVRLLADTPLGPAGMTARGHEFHYSKFVVGKAADEVKEVYGSTERTGAGQGCSGWLKNRCLGSHVHLYFRSCRHAAGHFAEACRTYRQLK